MTVRLSDAEFARRARERSHNWAANNRERINASRRKARRIKNPLLPPHKLTPHEAGSFGGRPRNQ